MSEAVKNILAERPIGAWLGLLTYVCIGFLTPFIATVSALPDQITIEEIPLKVIILTFGSGALGAATQARAFLSNGWAPRSN